MYHFTFWFFFTAGQREVAELSRGGRPQCLSVSSLERAQLSNTLCVTGKPLIFFVSLSSSKIGAMENSEAGVDAGF
jgi:hypothetical protein